MKRNKIWLIGFISLLLLLLAACGGNGDDDSSASNGDTSTDSGTDSGTSTDSGDANYPELTITFSHNQPLESPEHVGAEKFKEVVEEKSGGNIIVDVYPASQLGSLREQVESTQLGEIDITMQPSAVITPFADGIKIVDLPYLWPTDAEQMYSVMDGEVGKEILATLEPAGFTGLGFWPGGYKLFTTQNVEISAPEDLEGLTMRVMESPVLIGQYTHWGGNAIPVAYAEVYNALQQGIVDGQENPLQTIYLNNYHEVQENIIESYHGPMAYILMANSSWYSGLDENVQALLLEAEEEGRNAARENLSETEDEYRQNIIDSGVNFKQLSEEEIAKFKEASEPYWEEAYDEPEQLELLEKVITEIENVTP